VPEEPGRASEPSAEAAKVPGELSGGPSVFAPGPLLDGDPAVLRLALLARRRSEPVRLDARALDEARETLDRWRRVVAEWARQPSRPVPDEVRARLRAAWEDDLDVPGVLRVLRWVEGEPELPDGARFETYVHADRLLGLDLARDLGALP
jgi:cysteinyl-tRNA synthetase